MAGNERCSRLPTINSAIRATNVQRRHHYGHGGAGINLSGDSRTEITDLLRTAPSPHP
ncbi:MAG TPA: hypothetical protein VHH53_01980 [Pseudonocardiaceae bacterium]|nr:hypothetical protein [Pseudonocardiaceae bacterium]